MVTHGGSCDSAALAIGHNGPDMAEPLTADGLRASFLDFFAQRDHKLLPSLPLVPPHPAAPLFTNAGMVQFIPIFLGEERPAFTRAVSSQKCLRVRGKHDDIENVGRTTRHLTFFEMLGNFSFGDYFKAGAIELAWEFLVEVLGIERERLWVTVHESDDESEELWQDLIGLPANRIQRAGEDNFWEMGPTGPCGPCSEIFFDKGPEHGADGGPIGGGEERFVEIWNLVFTAFNRLEDGSLEALPSRNIDTGAGLERVLPVLQGTSSVFDTDVLRRLIANGEELTGATYGDDAETDVSLRILADHARAMTFLLGDGVMPSSEERGYVLRRIIRRAARHAQRAGAQEGVLPSMAATVAATMHAGYPELTEDLDRISSILELEEHRFSDRLSVGMALLDQELADGARAISGETAFKLHDTHGFPIDLTTEIARERGVEVDQAGFEAAMARQRSSGRAAELESGSGGALESRLLTRTADLDAVEFLGYADLEADATIVAVEEIEGNDRVSVVCDRTPFYAESGGQVGDTGEITSAGARGLVVDTQAPATGLVVHTVELSSGTLEAGDAVHLAVDRGRRAALRRSHTATHLLQWALRETLGPQLRQQGSLVTPDVLRFDFNHHAALSGEDLERVEDLVVGQILDDAAVTTDVMALADAQSLGAMSFFGERYGERVRVVSAGERSKELCGGTHVAALGQIGEFFIRSEASVGANVRRVEALTGRAAHAESHRQRGLLAAAAGALRVAPDDVVDALERARRAQQESERTRKRLAAELDRQVTVSLAESALDGIVVARSDGRSQQELRELALAVSETADVSVVGLVGTPDGTSVAIAVAAGAGATDSAAVVRAAARAVGGGGGGSPRVAMGGGSDVEAIGEALAAMRGALANGAG